MAETHVADTLLPQEKPRPALKLRFLSHGTLESRYLAFSRRFYEEGLGLGSDGPVRVERPTSHSDVSRILHREIIVVRLHSSDGGSDLSRHIGFSWSAFPGIGK